MLRNPPCVLYGFVLTIIGVMKWKLLRTARRCHLNGLARDLVYTPAKATTTAWRSSQISTVYLSDLMRRVLANH